VAVMFASIPHFMDYFAENDIDDGGLRYLEVLNSTSAGLMRYNFKII
jgi:hypothetical protein